MSLLDMVKEFHEKMGQPLDQKFEYNKPLNKLRFDLITEEYKEVFFSTTPEEILKELADLVYVVYGYAATYGWDLDQAVKLVHESNLSKLDENGKPIFREDGKVMKGPNYKKPNMKGLY